MTQNQCIFKLKTAQNVSKNAIKVILFVYFPLFIDCVVQVVPSKPPTSDANVQAVPQNIDIVAQARKQDGQQPVVACQQLFPPCHGLHLWWCRT